MNVNFRLLKAQEIECRVNQVIQKQNGNACILLLYKTARTDYALLDETVGSTNWKIDYKEVKGNMYCGISIFDSAKNEWITKWNCGTESNTEKEKGEASDACKRSGVAWGIGRELYTAPFIYVPLTETEVKNGKVYIKFEVDKISYDSERNISALTIVDESGKTRFTYPRSGFNPKPNNNSLDKEKTFHVNTNLVKSNTNQELAITKEEFALAWNKPEVRVIIEETLTTNKAKTLNDLPLPIAKQLIQIIKEKMKE